MDLVRLINIWEGASDVLKTLESSLPAHSAALGEFETDIYQRARLSSPVQKAQNVIARLSINLFTVKDRVDFIFIYDVCLLKKIIGAVFNVFQIFEITRVCECIKVYNFIIRILCYEKANHMRPNAVTYNTVAMRSGSVLRSTHGS